MADQQEAAHVMRLLEITHGNLAHLTAQVEMFDPKHLPLYIANQYSATLKQIEQLKARLEKLQKGGS